MRVHDGGGGRPGLKRRGGPGSLPRSGVGAERCLAQRRELECRSHGTAHQLAKRALGRSAGRQLGEHVFVKLGSGSDGTGVTNAAHPCRFGSAPRKMRALIATHLAGRPERTPSAGTPGYDSASQALHTGLPRGNRVASALSPWPIWRSFRHERPARRHRGARGHRVHLRRPAGDRPGPSPAPVPRQPRRRVRSAARHRPSRRQRLPARAHARVLRARDRDGRRLHRAGSGRNQGRPPDRPPRALHRQHDRREGQVPWAHARRHGRRWARRGRVLRRRLHVAGDQDPARQAAAGGTRPTSSTVASRSRRSTRFSSSPGARDGRVAGSSASTPRPSTRPITSSSGCRSSARSSTRCAAPASIIVAHP